MCIVGQGSHIIFGEGGIMCRLRRAGHNLYGLTSLANWS